MKQFRNESIERAWIEIAKRKTPEQWYSHWESQSDISAIAKSILKGHALNNEGVFEYFKIRTPYYIEHNFRYITHHHYLPQSPTFYHFTTQIYCNKI